MLPATRQIRHSASFKSAFSCRCRSSKPEQAPGPHQPARAAHKRAPPPPLNRLCLARLRVQPQPLPASSFTQPRCALMCPIGAGVRLASSRHAVNAQLTAVTVQLPCSKAVCYVSVALHMPWGLIGCTNAHCSQTTFPTRFKCSLWSLQVVDPAGSNRGAAELSTAIEQHAGAFGADSCCEDAAALVSAEVAMALQQDEIFQLQYEILQEQDSEGSDAEQEYEVSTQRNGDGDDNGSTAPSSDCNSGSEWSATETDSGYSGSMAPTGGCDEGNISDGNNDGNEGGDVRILCYMTGLSLAVSYRCFTARTSMSLRRSHTCKSIPSSLYQQRCLSVCSARYAACLCVRPRECALGCAHTMWWLCKLVVICFTRLALRPGSPLAKEPAQTAATQFRTQKISNDLALWSRDWVPSSCLMPLCTYIDNGVGSQTLRCFNPGWYTWNAWYVGQRLDHCNPIFASCRARCGGDGQTLAAPGTCYACILDLERRWGSVARNIWQAEPRCFSWQVQMDGVHFVVGQ